MLRPGSIATIFLLAALAAFGPISTDMYLPSLPSMTTVFHTDVSQVQMTLSIFYLGFAMAQLIYGPLSDRFGRRPILLMGVGLYVAASLLCATAPSINWLIFGRFVQALGASAGPVLGRAIVRDLFDRNAAAKVMSYMASAMALAPLVAPLLGGQLHVLFGWQANFIALSGFGVLIALTVWRTVQETNTHLDPRSTNPRRIAQNFAIIVRNPAFRGYVVVVACAFGALFSFISGSSFVLIDLLGVAPQWFGLCFMVVVAGYLSGSFLNARLAARFGVDTMIGIGALGTTLSGIILAALPWLGIETIITVIVPMSLAFLSIALILPNGMAGAVSPFPTMAGTASSLLGFLQLSSGAAIGALVGYLHDGTARPMTTAIAVMGILTLLAYLTLIHRRNNH